MSTEDIINQAMESAVIETPVEVATEEPTINEPQEASEENTSNEILESDDVAFPKKAVNALSRRDKTIAKLKADQAADRAELQRFRESSAKPQESSEPSEADFETYGEYLEAKVLHKIETKQNEGTREKQAAETVAQLEQWTEERSEYVANKAKEAVDNIPGYRELFLENTAILQELTPDIERAFLEADEPQLAFFALAKEGGLEALLDMSPTKIAMAIARAEIRGEAMTRVKQITKAPAPLSANKGNGMVSKSLNNMSSDELLKWARS